MRNGSNPLALERTNLTDASPELTFGPKSKGELLAPLPPVGMFPANIPKFAVERNMPRQPKDSAPVTFHSGYLVAEIYDVPEKSAAAPSGYVEIVGLLLPVNIAPVTRSRPSPNCPPVTMHARNSAARGCERLTRRTALPGGRSRGRAIWISTASYPLVLRLVVQNSQAAAAVLSRAAPLWFDSPHLNKPRGISTRGNV